MKKTTFNSLLLVRITHPGTVQLSGITNALGNVQAASPSDDLIAIQNHRVRVAFALFEANVIEHRFD